MLIGILQCGHFPTADGFPDRTYTDLYASLLDGRGLTFQTWSVVDMEFPDDVSQADGWLITGSKHGAYESHPFIPRLEDFIRTAYQMGVPQVGICFGHQIIAQALGGRVEKYEKGWSVGAVDYELDGKAMTLVAWHQDQVVEKPAAARVLSSTDFCKFAALSYGDRAFTLQPHPEFDADATNLLLDKRAPGVVPSDLIDAARLRVKDQLDRTFAADQIAAFFKEAAHV